MLCPLRPQVNTVLVQEIELQEQKLNKAHNIRFNEIISPYVIKSPFSSLEYGRRQAQAAKARYSKIRNLMYDSYGRRQAEAAKARYSKIRNLMYDSNFIESNCQ
jgi:hypothetical protein